MLQIVSSEPSSSLILGRYAAQESIVSTKAIIREAVPHEATLLSELALKSKAHWGYPAAFMEACRTELTYSPNDLEEHHFYVAEVKSSVAGFYALVQLSGEEIELEALFVEPSCIGQGYGRMLIEHAKVIARALGARVMHVQGDPNAEKFYLAAGGQRMGELESDSVEGRYLPLFTPDLSSAVKLKSVAGKLGR